MFYCDKCGNERGWPVGVRGRSVGPCEICGATSDCNDVPSAHLPLPKVSKERCMHYANHLNVRTRGPRKYENDRSPPPRVEVECTACGWTGWYVLEKKKGK